MIFPARKSETLRAMDFFKFLKIKKLNAKTIKKAKTNSGVFFVNTIRLFEVLEFFSGIIRTV